MSSKRLAVEVDGLSKRYLLSHQEKHAYMGDAILAKLKNPFAKPEKEEFWALKDVSFDVEQGEVLGIIGRNGAGKSTMLKILSQIAEPTSGEVRMHGKVGALLEVGTGFHPELSGRENIFLNGTILGMRKRDVAKRFDEIVDFAEIERFIDTPVKRYSSGMYVRLAFAIAANLDPEILIVDEVLAVGDAKFQAKCLGKMKDIAAGEGRTVLFVSHSAAAVKSLCTKAVLLKNGKLQYYGDVGAALDIYEEAPAFTGTIIQRACVENAGITIDSVTVNGSDSAALDLPSGETTLDIVISGSVAHPLRAGVEIKLNDTNGVRLAVFGEGFMTRTAPRTMEGPFEWQIRVDLPRNINEGDYVVDIDVAEQGVQYWVRIENAIQIHCGGVLAETGEPFRYSEKSGLVLLDGEVHRRVVAEKIL